MVRAANNAALRRLPPGRSFDMGGTETNREDKMKRYVLPALPIALLFACSPSAVALQPGMWETTIQFTSIDVPGAPPAQLTAMRAMMGQPQTRSECMTPEQAANPAQRMMNPEGTNGCQFSDSTFAGGTIRVHGTCQAQGRGSSQTSMEGTYTATTIQATISSDMHPPAGTAGPQSVHMAGTISARRTGDCPA
jgi:uncharacterized protein DUF3617